MVMPWLLLRMRGTVVPDLTVQPDNLPSEAAVTDRDKALAPRFWAKYATPLLKRLLNARTK